MARILSRRADGAPDTAPAPTDDPAADQPTAIVPTPGDAAVPEANPTIAPPAVADDPTAEVPAVAEAPPEPLPDAATRATLRNRSSLRRRLRYLRRVREIGFRDLGGLVFDLDRFGRERPDLVDVKLSGLKAIDAELRALEVALDDVRDFEELHEPGVSACLRCGALHGSEARFCPACGIAVGAPPPAPAAAELPAAAPAEAPPAEPEQPAA